MRLLEHQSKTLLSEFGLGFTVPTVVHTAAEAAAAQCGCGGPVVLKAQVPFGGRGKAGGVLMAATPDEAAAAGAQLLALIIRGIPVISISVEPRMAYLQELYAGITWDTRLRRPVAILSAAGGVDVEAGGQGERGLFPFDPRIGLWPYEGRALAAAVGLQGKALVNAGGALAQLARAFLAIDAVTAEINPLVITAEGAAIGLDAHVEIDDDAASRQNERLKALGEIASSAGRAPTALELEAQRIDAMDHRGVAGRVVEFDGDLGLLIGGGGASLTVFDAIRRYHGRPANYCEVGGNPTAEKVAALVQLLLSKPGVRRLAVIMNVVNNTRADVMAQGVLAGVAAAGRIPAETISVFRIPGSWEDEARQLLASHGVMALGRETSLDACARLAVERLSGETRSHAA